MIFFLDENFPKMAHTILGNAGHTVLDIRSTDKEGLPDNELFQLAKQGRAIFLTTDKDYYHTIHLTEKPHFGIIVIALRLPNSFSILAKLDWFLENHSHESKYNNRCFLLTDNRCTVFE